MLLSEKKSRWDISVSRFFSAEYRVSYEARQRNEVESEVFYRLYNYILCDLAEFFFFSSRCFNYLRYTRENIDFIIYAIWRKKEKKQQQRALDLRERR